MAVDMAKEGIMSKEEAVERIKSEDIERLFYPVSDPSVPKAELTKRKMATGINAVRGAAAGKAVFSAEEAEVMAAKGERVILVRRETSPEDVGGMFVAQGIVTATGGKTSHGAVVAVGGGELWVVGCEQLDIEYATKTASSNGRKIHEGEWMTLDGNEGAVYEGEVKLSTPKLPDAFSTLMGWADGVRRLGVRTNADTPHDAKKAREMGAEGIGLVRTEHMFFKDFEHPEKSADRQFAIQEMIVADSPEARRKALAKLLPYQRQGFMGIFREMDGYPVTIRLLDPPLHEFVPHDREKQEELARKIGVDVEVIARRVEQLHESNPMLGHRGCRLCITYPEILEMQVRAVIEAAAECQKLGVKVLPEIMIPLTLDPKKLWILDQATRRVPGDLIKKSRISLPYLVAS